MRYGLKGAIFTGFFPVLTPPFQSASPPEGQPFEKKFVKSPGFKKTAEHDVAILGSNEGGQRDKNFLFDAPIASVHRHPLQWHLIVTVAQPGDPTDDSTLPWPPDRWQVHKEPSTNPPS